MAETGAGGRRARFQEAAGPEGDPGKRVPVSWRAGRRKGVPPRERTEPGESSGPVSPWQRGSRGRRAFAPCRQVAASDKTRLKEPARKWALVNSLKGALQPVPGERAERWGAHPGQRIARLAENDWAEPD